MSFPCGPPFPILIRVSSFPEFFTCYVIAYLRHTNVCSVLRLEEHNSSPVVRLVLNEAAGGALGQLCRVVGGVHGYVKRVTSDNLMEMRRVLHSGVDERVSSLDDKLRASKSQHVLRSDIACKGSGRSEEGSPLHSD
jgi:hypothetical protein